MKQWTTPEQDLINKLVAVIGPLPPGPMNLGPATAEEIEESAWYLFAVGFMIGRGAPPSEAMRICNEMAQAGLLQKKLSKKP